jgi:tetratricopeptide (TPR) repeat protein
MIPRDFLIHLARRAGISDNELEVLSRAIAGEPLAAIARDLDIRKDALQKRLGEVYKKFDIAGSGPGKLAKLQQFLVAEYQSQVAAKPAVPRGEAPEGDRFFDRTPELDTLKSWLMADPAPVVMLWGAGGIGKTALAARTVREIAPHFDRVIWRSLRRTPTWDDLFPTGDRALLVVDDLETLSPSEIGENWGRHLQARADSGTPTLLIGWEPPAALISLIEDQATLQMLELNGLPDSEAEKLLANGKLTPVDAHFRTELIHLYGGNPRLLQLISTQFFNRFLETPLQLIQQTTLNVEKIIRQYRDDWNDLEPQLLCWLALHNRPVAREELTENLMVTEDAIALTPILESLEARSLIESVAGDRFILSPAVRRLISHHLLAKYLNQLGYQHYLDGEFQSARSALTDAIRYNPNLAPAHYNLGSTDERLQQFASARNHYEIAAKGGGRAAHAAVSNLARLALLEGDAEAAIASIQKISDRVSDPDVKVALQKNLGWAYFLKNDPDRAEQHLRNTLDIGNKNSAVFYLLAQVLEVKGERQQALPFWESGLAADDRDRASSTTPWRQPELEGWRAIARQRVNAGTPQKA